MFKEVDQMEIETIIYADEVATLSQENQTSFLNLLPQIELAHKMAKQEMDHGEELTAFIQRVETDKGESLDKQQATQQQRLQNIIALEAET